jgi:electron transport complex protein RnfB
LSIQLNASTELIDQIDNILPQTQCTRCGYPSCRDYATAIANNEAEINQCPPGGENGIEKLANLTDKPILPLNPENGVIKPKTLVAIDEDICIGCTLCIKACPVDAILGSNKMLHTVIASECTGCDLCVPVCPVDCIDIIDDPDSNWNDVRIKKAKNRYENRNTRIINDKKERENRLKERSKLLLEKFSDNK